MWPFKNMKAERANQDQAFALHLEQLQLDRVKSEAALKANRIEWANLEAEANRSSWIRDTAVRLLLERDGFTWENALVAARRIYDGSSEAKSEAKT